MTDDFLFDVFLSHSTHDKPQVLALAERLRQHGVRVWYDDWEIKPGNSIPLKINEGLAQSRRVALCMSAHAFAADWVGMEIQTILHADPLNKKGRFIPIRLDNTPTKPEFAPFAAIDWRTQSANAWQQLLNTFLPRQPLPAPPNFSVFVQTWPHGRSALQLSFLNDAQQATHRAHCASNLDQCDSFILRITTHQPGQLLLLLQNADHTFCQLYPNTLTPPRPLGAGEHYLPGTLLDLSRHPPAQQRLCFLTPGVERVLGFLLPALPGNIRTQEPMQRLGDATISEILMTLQNEPHASMALATITVYDQAAP